MDINKLILDPTKDEAAATEFGAKQPGETGKLTINYRVESVTDEMIELQVDSIESEVQEELDSLEDTNVAPETPIGQALD